MKKFLPLLSFGILLAFSVCQLSAQDEKLSKVTITITENNKVTTATTFELKEGQDPEMIKTIVTQLSGDDKHGQHGTVVIRKGEKDVKVVKKVGVEIEVEDETEDDDETKSEKK